MTDIAPAAICLALAVSAFVVLRRDWMLEFRFATPVAVSGAALLGTLACAVITMAGERRLPRWKPLLATLVAVVLFVQVGVNTVHRSGAFARTPTVPGCHIADRYGRTFNLYADRLGVDQGSFLVPDLGGVLLTSRLRTVDLAGLTEPTIARLRGQNNMAGIRDYVLSEVRPTFVHLHRPWDAGLLRDSRFRSDYVTIVPGADYVRRDAVSAAKVARLRPEAVALAGRLMDARRSSPLAGCGALAIGQLPPAR